MQTEVIANIPDNVLLQEMLRRQMESLKQRAASNVEGQRLQSIIQKQLDRSSYQKELIIGENARYYSMRKVNTDSPPRVTETEIRHVHQNIQKQLTALDMPTLPSVSRLDGEKEIQQIYSTIISLCQDIKQTKEKNRLEMQSLEKELYEQQHEQKAAFEKCEKQMDQKQQKISMLNQEISNEEILMKEEKKQHMLKIRPKKQMLEKLERRHRIIRETQ
ncbi:hypothetical protein TRFO_04209 [Tritrichomonas foetus]|uniref:Uncharacterized protein n=1 Tax=Tritrichomonas foetus TaxID=1144522 RepID=A0A1J4KHL0_9EUKA|nr:hypothetical protein TRFO_04209 [Tritrichomonas foetus]|eukprot:OHT10691.1 hypothetical protein TRFO_04209 [Tritrichomonas foetus]